MQHASVPAGRTVKLAGRGDTFVREAAGPPGAPTVVLLHGLLATAAINWPGAFDALSPYFRVIALDHRGHGRGVRGAQPFSLTDCADDVVALADVLGVERIVTAGYSMGGPIALYTARRHPDRVQAMVLCATSACFEGAEGLELAMADAFAMGLRFTPPALRSRVTSQVVRMTGGWSRLSPELLEEMARHDPAAVVEATNAVRRFDARGWAGHLQVPAAVVVTALDRTVRQADQLELARLTGASVHTVAADHEVAMEAPEVFLPALTEACVAVVTPPPAPDRPLL